MMNRQVNVKNLEPVLGLKPDKCAKAHAVSLTVILSIVAVILNSAPEPLSLCTLPLNEGNCTSDASKPASSPGSGSLAAAFARKRFYFNKEESKCMEFTHQVSLKTTVNT